MLCPVEGCGGTTRVRESRPRPTHVRRRRNCERCGHTFSTAESIVADGTRVHVDSRMLCGVLMGLVNGIPPVTLAARWQLPLSRVLELKDELKLGWRDNARLAREEAILSSSPTDGPAVS